MPSPTGVAILDHICPTCGAQPGQFCKQAGKAILIAHKDRGSRRAGRGVDTSWRYKATCKCCERKLFKGQTQKRTVLKPDGKRGKATVCESCISTCLREAGTKKARLDSSECPHG